MTKSTSQYEQLLGELETMAKALPAESGEGGSAASAAAGGGGGEGGELTDEQKAAAAAEAAEASKGGEPMAKSFKVKMPDGTEVDALDGAEMVKALTDQVGSLETNVGQMMTSVVGLLKKQGEALANTSTMLKSLQEDMAKLGGQGAGRKAMVAITEKPDPTQMAKANAGGGGMNPTEFMAKANEAWKAGKLSGDEISLAETYINRAEQPPVDIVRKVIAA